MENAPDDFDFGVMQLPERGRFRSLVMGWRIRLAKYHTEQKILKPLMNSSNIFLSPEVQEKFGEKVLISWQVKQPTRI